MSGGECCLLSLIVGCIGCCRNLSTCLPWREAWDAFFVNAIGHLGHSWATRSGEAPAEPDSHESSPRGLESGSSQDSETEDEKPPTHTCTCFSRIFWAVVISAVIGGLYIFLTSSNGTPLDASLAYFETLAANTTTTTRSHISDLDLVHGMVDPVVSRWTADRLGRISEVHGKIDVTREKHDHGRLEKSIILNITQESTGEDASTTPGAGQQASGAQPADHGLRPRATYAGGRWWRDGVPEPRRGAWRSPGR